ncbi:hypothetical protein UFOVP393_65 [uncultured Caudovirales phage]|uniref:Uncharacterized protein n=1 Tax=uncultured Caudovirales phage TaxID=2100421 RepID=A0A6J7XAN4_9CAUD|nr:hypothetical protein UFOVP393_65 [uncultured Caudovirales phage]
MSKILIEEDTARKVLKALEDHGHAWARHEEQYSNAMIAMREALTAPVQQEPVRIYDYVWPQRDEHKEECVYACSYTPGHHLARGELLAVVHPSQLKNAYLQRDDESAPQPAPVQQILAAFPLLDDGGLDQEEHHCEWTLQQDRKRLHAMLAAAPQPEQQQEPVAHCEGGPDVCPVCRAETRSLALAAAIGYVQRNTPTLVSTEICNALNHIPDATKMVAEPEQPAQQEPVAKDNSNYRLDPPGLDQLCTSPPAQRKPLPRILDICDTGQNSLQLIFKNRFDADAYKAAIKEKA